MNEMKNENEKSEREEKEKRIDTLFLSLSIEEEVREKVSSNYVNK